MVFKNVVWVGRLSGPKGDLAHTLATEIFPFFPDIQFDLVGGPAVPEEWQDTAPNVRFTGQVADVSHFYRDADLVIGAGRVALEAMIAGKPVIAVGEGCYIGPVGTKTIARAKATNFGDCFSPPFIDYPRLKTDLEDVFTGKTAIDTSGYPSFLQEYDRNHVNRCVRNIVYRQAAGAAALRKFREVPVLMYHRVTDGDLTDSRFNIHVSKDRLEKQFKSLKRRGFTPITFKDIANGKRVKKPVVLTFDDGYTDNYENLLPLLEAYGFKAVIFVLGNRRLKNNAWDMAKGEHEALLMNDSQVRACHDSGLVEIGSHGLNHEKLPGLTDEEVACEIVESRKSLESLTGEEVITFAYPYGEYSDREVAAVRDAGYLFGIGTVNGPLRLVDDFYRIRRVHMRPKDDALKFRHKSSGFYLRYCRFKGKDF